MSRDRSSDPSWTRQDEAVEMSQINPGYLDDSIPRDGNHPIIIDMGNRIPLERRHSYDEGHQWARHGQGSLRDAAELISELPSRQLDRMISDTGKSVRARRKSQRKPSLGGSLRHRPTDDLAASLTKNDDFMDELDGDVKTNEILRGMSSQHLSDKRQIKHKVTEKRKERTLSRKSQPKTIGTWKNIKYQFGMTWLHFKNNMKEFAYSLELWKSLMKKVEGHFGTGVTSYFLFLKWIFLLNIPVFILTFGFVVVPQILFRYNQPTENTTSINPNISTFDGYYVPFSGEEFLTGAGWFNNTELYYGFYTHLKVAVPLTNRVKYDMKYAYLLTCGGYYILCLVILALSISKSYKKNYVEGSGTANFYNVSRVFCGWDYNITSKDASDLKHKSFYNEMKEYLAGTKKKEKKEMSYHCKWFFIRVLTNLIIFGMIGGSGYLIFYILDQNLSESDVPILGELTMPLCISAIHLVFPFIFARIGSLEQYEKPKTELYIGMFRVMLLKGSLLGILVSFWFRRLPNSVYCWETKVGNELYRLVLVDFFFILGATFFLEFIHRIMANYCCTEKLKEPEFDIGRNTLDLIYSQALCWMGTFYSPLLSVMMIVKLFILFYVKVVSVLQNCRPSSKAWRASRTHTIFLGFLFFFFLLTTVAVAVGIITIKPSDDCGPFRGQEKAYDAVLTLVDSWKDEYPVLHEIVKVISSPGVIAGILVLLCVGTYYTRIVMIGHKEMVNLLRHQLTMEGKDKAYLLRKLQKVRSRKKERAAAIGQGGRLLPGNTNMKETTDNGKRLFTRKLAETASASMENLATASPRNRRHPKK